MNYFTFILSLSLFVLTNGLTMGPIGNIIINYLELCEDQPLNENVNIQINLKAMDEKDTKALFLNFSSKYTIDDEITYTLNLRKWDSGWQDVLAHNGKVCVDFERYSQKIWDNLRAATTPEIPEKCRLEPGFYTVTNFQPSAKDYGIPAIFYGKLSAEFKLFKGDEVLACIYVDANSQSPTYF